MKQNNYTDPLLLVVRSRQEDLMKEAEYERLAAQAGQRLNSAGQPLNRPGKPRRRIQKPEVTIWRRTAWSLGRAAFSVGTWLLAR